ncbi:hypothetical protein MHYP_G00111490 [Metynnis hypsauchen]
MFLSVKVSRTPVNNQTRVLLDLPARQARARTRGKARQSSRAVSKTACWDTPGSADQTQSCSAGFPLSSGWNAAGPDDRLP